MSSCGRFGLAIEAAIAFSVATSAAGNVKLNKENSTRPINERRTLVDARFISFSLNVNRIYPRIRYSKSRTDGIRNGKTPIMERARQFEDARVGLTGSWFLQIQGQHREFDELRVRQ
jgi:hypothetical protein